MRKDIFDLAGYASDIGFTVVLGTNGVLLREAEAKRMRQSGIQGASISLDSVDAARHDAFRRLPGSWDAAVRAPASDLLLLLWNRRGPEALQVFGDEQLLADWQAPRPA